MARTPSHPQPSPKNAPAVIDTPYLGGDPLVGARLTCTMGNWEGEPTDYEYAWRLNETPIEAALGSSYLVLPENIGAMVDCVVTARNQEGELSATSNAIGPIQEGQGAAESGLTSAEEQRARSTQIQAMGVDAWKAAHDERPEGERSNPQVPGVGPSQISEGMSPEPGSWKGSTRSTPEARQAQRKAAP